MVINVGQNGGAQTVTFEMLLNFLLSYININNTSVAVLFSVIIYSLGSTKKKSYSRKYVSKVKFNKNVSTFPYIQKRFFFFGDVEDRSDIYFFKSPWEGYGGTRPWSFHKAEPEHYRGWYKATPDDKFDW